LYRTHFQIFPPQICELSKVLNLKHATLKSKSFVLRENKTIDGFLRQAKFSILLPNAANKPIAKKTNQRTD